MICPTQLLPGDQLTKETNRKLGWGFLAVGLVVLLVNFAGMSSMIEKVASSRELNLVALVLVLGGSGFLRSARRQEP